MPSLARPVHAWLVQACFALYACDPNAEHNASSPAANVSPPPTAAASSPPPAASTAPRPAASSTPPPAPAQVAPPASPSASTDTVTQQADTAEYLGLDLPERGFRLSTRGLEVAPGSDVEYCEIAEVPGNPGEQYNVSGIELANAQGSHHLIVTMAAPGSASERQLQAHALGEQVPCIGAQQEFGLSGMSVLASSQTHYVKSSLPDGIGQRVFGGQRLVFDYHYFNFGSEPLTAKSAMAVHTFSPNEPVTFVSSLAFSNMTLDVPAMSERTFTAACTLQHAAMLSGFARHTHQFGTDFSVWFEGGPQAGQHIWTSSDWEHDTDFKFPEPRLMQPGEGFKFACSFKNPGTKPLRFGISASDEMCILGALIWSPEPQAELAPEQCVITWIDAQGIGRDTDEAGGFPPAEPIDALSCHAGSLGISLVESCVGCICNACATILARCNADTDCKALLDCNSSCSKLGSMECAQQCEPVMFEHSSAVGLITQVGECLRAGCGTECNIVVPMP